MWRTPLVDPNLKEINISYLKEGQVAIVSLNRPQKHNALTFDTFFQLQTVFKYLGRSGSDVRAIIFTGEGKNLTAGIDLFVAPMDLLKLREKEEETDPGRAAIMFIPVAVNVQNAILEMEKVRVPVIAAINGLCLGAGNDLISSCDIRICQANSRFSIKEVDIGMASDIGIH